MMRDAYTHQRALEYMSIYGSPDNPEPQYLSRMANIVHLIPEGSVLDVGCGLGHLYGQLRIPEYIGIDSSPSMIMIAQIFFPKVDFRVMNAFDCRSIDPVNTVVAVSLLIHVEPELHQKLLQRMWETCKTNLIFTIPINEDKVIPITTQNNTLIVNISYETFMKLCQGLKPKPSKIYTQNFPLGSFGYGLGDVLVRLTK